MAFLRSLAIGLLGACGATLLWIVVTVVVPFIVPMVLARLKGDGGIAAVSVSSGSLLIVFLVGFVVAFGWSWLRSGAR